MSIAKHARATIMPETTHTNNNNQPYTTLDVIPGIQPIPTETTPYPTPHNITRFELMNKTPFKSKTIDIGTDRYIIPNKFKFELAVLLILAVPLDIAFTAPLLYDLLSVSMFTDYMAHHVAASIT